MSDQDRTIPERLDDAADGLGQGVNAVSGRTDWLEVGLCVVCLTPAPLLVLWMAWRVVFG